MLQPSNIIHSTKSRMATSFCNCCLFVGFLIIISNGVIDAKILQSNNPVEFIHKSLYRNINNKRSLSLSLRQSCSSILDIYPTECNVTLLAGNISSVPSVNDLDALNNAYSQFCIPKCIDPLISYYCCTYTGDLLTYLTNLLEHGVCGKHNNDFCEVLYLRRYANNRNFINVLINACPLLILGFIVLEQVQHASNMCQTSIQTWDVVLHHIWGVMSVPVVLMLLILVSQFYLVQQYLVLVVLYLHQLHLVMVLLLLLCSLFLLLYFLHSLSNCCEVNNV